MSVQCNNRCGQGRALRCREIQSERFSTACPLDAVASETGEESLLHGQNSGAIFHQCFVLTNTQTRTQCTETRANTRTTKHIQPHAHTQRCTQTCTPTRGPLFHGLTRAGSKTVTVPTTTVFTLIFVVLVRAMPTLSVILASGEEVLPRLLC